MDGINILGRRGLHLGPPGTIPVQNGASMTAYIEVIRPGCPGRVQVIPLRQGADKPPSIRRLCGIIKTKKKHKCEKKKVSDTASYSNNSRNSI
jgi:hypothetical protein